jgi:hypothetical protein
MFDEIKDICATSRKPTTARSRINNPTDTSRFNFSVPADQKSGSSGFYILFKSTLNSQWNHCFLAFNPNRKIVTVICAWAVRRQNYSLSLIG